MGNDIAKFLNLKATKNEAIQLFDSNNNLVYYEDYTGYWRRKEYDQGNRLVYAKDKNGWYIDHRPKELTQEQIEKELGYKIKIIGGECK